MEFWIVVAGFLAGSYMAWNIGANDIANGMASAVGARAITLRQAVIIGGILDFAGAVLVGSHVTTTICKNIIDANAITGDPKVMMLGLLAALLAAAFWVFFSTWSEFPVSTTHSIVGAILGFGLVEGGMRAVYWGKLISIVLSWIISPIFAGVLAFLTFNFIKKSILQRSKRMRQLLFWSPLFGGITFLIVSLSLLLKTPLGDKFKISDIQAISVSLACGLMAGGVSFVWVRKLLVKYSGDLVEEVFRRFQVFTSCYVAFSHGANDVANAIGPVAGIYAIYQTHNVSPTVPVPTYLLAFGGAFIALGVFTWGYKVIETVGSKITTLNNTRGYSVDFGTATSVLLASKMGLPVSTTHAAVGAVIGVGLAGGISAVDFGVVWRIVLYWVVTLPLSAIPTMVIFKLLKFLFL